ncbi:hypothetical protein NW759_004317 [Fusarium solani]|nr:hypothetical protein NW759_004317 [Fusarium solani]
MNCEFATRDRDTRSEATKPSVSRYRPPITHHLEEGRALLDDYYVSGIVPWWVLNGGTGERWLIMSEIGSLPKSVAMGWVWTTQAGPCRPGRLVGIPSRAESQDAEPLSGPKLLGNRRPLSPIPESICRCAEIVTVTQGMGTKCCADLA